MWRSGTNRRADKIDLQHDGDDVDGNVGRHVLKVFLGLLELKLHHVQEPQTLERGLVFHNVRYESLKRDGQIRCVIIAHAWLFAWNDQPHHQPTYLIVLICSSHLIDTPRYVTRPCCMDMDLLLLCIGRQHYRDPHQALLIHVSQQSGWSSISIDGSRLLFWIGLLGRAQGCVCHLKVPPTTITCPLPCRALLVESRSCARFDSV